MLLKNKTAFENPVTKRIPSANIVPHTISGRDRAGCLPKFEEGLQVRCCARINVVQNHVEMCVCVLLVDRKKKGMILERSAEAGTEADLASSDDIRARSQNGLGAGRAPCCSSPERRGRVPRSRSSLRHGHHCLLWHVILGLHSAWSAWTPLCLVSMNKYGGPQIVMVQHAWSANSQ